MGEVDTTRFKRLLADADEVIEAAKNEATTLGVFHTQLAEAEYAIVRAGWQLGSACRCVVKYHVAVEET